MERIAEGPRPSARAAGLVYLSYFLTAFLPVILMKGIVVPGDAAATATNLVAHEGLYRAGFATGLLSDALYLAATAFFYRLFGPGNWSLSLVAALFSFVGCTTQIIGRLFQLAPLVLLKNPQWTHVFGVEQVQAAVMVSLLVYQQTFSISLLLFGFFEIAFGCLMFRSRFVPRIMGVAWMLAGAGGLTVAWPPLILALRPVVIGYGGLMELALLIWLLTKGVDAARWREKAADRAIP
jgi:hypothetical protein